MIERGWWIDPQRFLGHPNPSLSELASLYNEGVRAVIILVEDDGYLRYDAEDAERIGLDLYRIPIPDFEPPQPADFAQLIKIMRALPAGEKAMMHCIAGNGRTGTMAAGYLVYQGVDAGTAIRRIRKANPDAIETMPQQESVYQLMADLRNDRDQ